MHCSASWLGFGSWGVVAQVGGSTFKCEELPCKTAAASPAAAAATAGEGRMQISSEAVAAAAVGSGPRSSRRDESRH